MNTTASKWTRTPAGIHKWIVDGETRAEIVKDGTKWLTVMYLPGYDRSGKTSSYGTLRESKSICETVWTRLARGRSEAPVTRSPFDGVRYSARCDYSDPYFRKAS